MSDERDDADELLVKVHAWLQTNGYPLEYETQHALDEAGLGSIQGFHVQDPKTGAVREIDLVASVRRRCPNGQRIHCAHVVECKDNGRPWVAFTRPTATAPQFCIEETIANRRGQRAMYALSKDNDLHALDLFRRRDATAFSGSEAFKARDAKDACYSALQSVVSASAALAAIDDDQIAVVFPVIVLGGRLLTASFDMKSRKMVVGEAAEVRFHWRGAEVLGGALASVDVVTAAHLPTWAAQRKRNVDTLMKKLVAMTAPTTTNS